MLIKLQNKFIENLGNIVFAFLYKSFYAVLIRINYFLFYVKIIKPKLIKWSNKIIISKCKMIIYAKIQIHFIYIQNIQSNQKPLCLTYEHLLLINDIDGKLMFKYLHSF